MSTTTTSQVQCPEPILRIYRVARAISEDTRGRVRADLNGCLFVSPADRWAEHIAARAAASSILTAAGRSLVKLAVPPAKPYVRRGVKNLLDAVKGLADYRPQYAEQTHTLTAAESRELNLGTAELRYSTWIPTPDSVAELDELRNRVKCALITLASLFERHETPAARVLAVARRIAAVVLEPTAAALVQGWLAKLERGDRAAA